MQQNVISMSPRRASSVALASRSSCVSTRAGDEGGEGNPGQWPGWDWSSRIAESRSKESSMSASPVVGGAASAAVPEVKVEVALFFFFFFCLEEVVGSAACSSTIGSAAEGAAAAAGAAEVGATTVGTVAVAAAAGAAADARWVLTRTADAASAAWCAIARSTLLRWR